MRLLVLTDSYPPHNLGGAGEVAHLVSTGLAQRGHDVLVVTAARGRHAAGRERVDGVTVQRIWAPVPAPLRLHLSVVNPVAALRVRRIAAAFRPDAVHAHNVHERLSFVSLGAARVSGAPVVLTAHDYLLFCLTKFLCSQGDVRFQATPTRCPHCQHIRRVPWRNQAVHAIVRRSVDTIACISQAQRTALATNGFSDVPLEVVYNGLDFASCETRPVDGANFRRRHGLDGRPIVLFGGRISGAKGGDQLLRAVACARQRADCQLAILGDREAYFTHARRLAGEVGLALDALRTIGWLSGDPLREAFGAADVCATPSVYPDPFNLMTLRAMGHAKPVVGTIFGATPELVVDGVTGYLADPWDPAAFGDRIADLLVDPSLAARMGAAGQQRARAEFPLSRQLDGYQALLERPSRHTSSTPATGAGASR